MRPFRDIPYLVVSIPPGYSSPVSNNPLFLPIRLFPRRSHRPLKAIFLLARLSTFGIVIITHLTLNL